MRIRLSRSSLFTLFSMVVLGAVASGISAIGCGGPVSGPDITPDLGSSQAALTDDQCDFFDADGHVQICHHTSSITHPFTIIKTSVQGCVDGHAGHAQDYVAVGDPTCQGGGCLPVTAPCDDTLPCCDGLTCQNGTCVDLCAGVVCTPSDTCHAAGICNPATGLCGPGASLGDTTTGLVHHWTFDEPSGTTATDSAGASDGTLGSTAQRWTSFDSSGAIAFSPRIECDRQAEVDFGNAPGAFGTADFTVSFWVATTFSGTGQGDLIGNRIEGDRGNNFEGRLAGNGFMNGGIDDNVNFAAINSFTPVNDGRWHNVVYARTGTTLSLYLDGSLDGSGTSDALVNILGDRPFKLGRSLPCLSGFHSIPGVFDDVRIYGRGLGVCDARDLAGANAGTPATFPPPPPPSCPCAGTPAWTTAIAAPADACDAGPGFAIFAFGDFGQAGASDDPDFSFCFAQDPSGNFVQFAPIAPADADVCLAQIHAVACP
jgi:hypothetical protein